MRRLRNVTGILFLVFLLAYFCLFLLSPRLGPIDDHVLLDTLQLGKRLDFFMVPRSGRFYPLDAQEYNVVAALFSPAPFYYYLFNALQFLCLIFLFRYVLKKVDSGSKLIRPALFYLILLPGFTAAFFRLQVPERDSLFYFTLFLCFYLRHLEKKDFLDLALGLISANVALYYKEPGFLMLGSFALFHLLTARESRRQRVFDILLIFSSMVFAGVYYWVSFRFIGAHRYGETSFDPVLLFLKNLLFFMLSDPLIAILLPLLLGWRLFLILKKKENFHPVFDSLLIGSLAYFLAYLVLKIQTYHYLLPIYAFLLPSLLFFRLPRRKVAILALSLLVLNSSLIGLHSLSNTKYIPFNYDRMLSKLASVIPSDGKTSLFLDGVNPASGCEIYQSLGKFLNARGIGNAHFDLKSDLYPDNLVLAQTDARSPYSVFRGGPCRIERNDYLIITPQTAKEISPSYLEGLGRDYDLIYCTDSPYAFPDVSLKAALKGLALGWMRLSRKEELDSLVSANLLHRPDYYIFRRR